MKPTYILGPVARLSASIARYRAAGYIAVAVRLNPAIFPADIKSICGVPASYGTEEATSSWEVRLGHITVEHRDEP